MDGDLWTQILLIMLLIGLNAFFAASEMAIISVRQSRIKPLVDEGNKAAVLVNKFLEEPSKLLATIQIGITLAGFLASAIGAQTLTNGLTGFLMSLNIPFISASAAGSPHISIPHTRLFPIMYTSSSFSTSTLMLP